MNILNDKTDSAVNCTMLEPWGSSCLEVLPERTLRLLKRIHLAHSMGKRKKQDYLSKDYLNTDEAKSVATQLAYRALRRGEKRTPDELKTIARSLDAWKGTTEAVEVRFKRKPNGDYRPIMEFGIENRALQYLILPILRVFAQLQSCQYGMRGNHAAITRVKSLLTEGYVWGTQTDISECFPSFEMERVMSLIPLPKEVVENVIFSKHFNLTSSQLGTMFGPPELGDEESPLIVESLDEARRGIPQGSAVANLVAEMMLALPLASLNASPSVTAFADNTLCLAKDEKSAVSMKETLWAAIKAAPVGLLRPKLVNLVEPGGSFNFLGHHFKWVNGKLEVRPTEEHAHEFQLRWQRGLRRIKTANGAILRQRRARELRKYVKSWTGARMLCDGMDSLRAERLFQINEIRNSSA